MLCTTGGDIDYASWSNVLVHYDIRLGRSGRNSLSPSLRDTVVEESHKSQVAALSYTNAFASILTRFSKDGDMPDCPAWQAVSNFVTDYVRWPSGQFFIAMTQCTATQYPRYWVPNVYLRSCYSD
jgi:hypothetical protein